MSNCIPCDDFSCAKDVPSCAVTLNLGEDNSAYPSGDYKVFVEYFMGDDKVVMFQRVTLTYGTEISLDLTDPSKDRYNAFNGLYKVWVTNQTGSINDKIQIVQGTKRYKTAAFNFVKVDDSTITTVDLEIV